MSKEKRELTPEAQSQEFLDKVRSLQEEYGREIIAIISESGPRIRIVTSGAKEEQKDDTSQPKS